MFDKKERFRLVKEEAEKQHKKRQEELMERMKRMEENQKRISEKKAREQEKKKEEQILKEKAKEENILRHQRKKDYKKELYMSKLKFEEQTFKEMRKLKTQVIQERYYNHMIDEIKKNQMKECVEQMHLNKKFSKQKIRAITKDFEFLAATDQKV